MRDRRQDAGLEPECSHHCLLVGLRQVLRAHHTSAPVRQHGGQRRKPGEWERRLEGRVRAGEHAVPQPAAVLVEQPDADVGAAEQAMHLLGDGCQHHHQVVAGVDRPCHRRQRLGALPLALLGGQQVDPLDRQRAAERDRGEEREVGRRQRRRRLEPVDERDPDRAVVRAQRRHHRRHDPMPAQPGLVA